MNIENVGGAGHSRATSVPPWVLLGGLVVACGLAVMLPPPYAEFVIVVSTALVGLALVGTRGTKADPRVLAKPSVAPELVLLPLAVSIRQSPMLLLAAVGIVAFIALARRRQVRRPFRVSGPLLVLVAAAAIVLVRNLPAALLLIAIVATVGISLVKTSKEAAVNSLLDGLALYMFANIAGWIVGLQSPAALVRIGGYESSLLFSERVLFPFTRSINEGSIVAVGYLAALAALRFTGHRTGNLHRAGALAAGIVILASNSRVAGVMCVVVIAALALADRWGPRILIGLAGAMAVLPLALTRMQPTLDWAAERLATLDVISRGQSAEQISGLGTRGGIWTGAWNYWLQSNLPLSNRMFGWGPNGHVSSGANSSYVAGRTGFLSDTSALTTHSWVLQQLFDAGIIGVLLLACGLVWLLARLLRDETLRPLAVATIGLAVASCLEVSLAPGATTTAFFLVLTFAALADGASTMDGDDAHLDSNIRANRARRPETEFRANQRTDRSLGSGSMSVGDR
ncbi:MAG: O-antigen ligase family protein [Aeromicrobium sp.]